jgi:hypothetical protein
MDLPFDPRDLAQLPLSDDPEMALNIVTRIAAPYS